MKLLSKNQAQKCEDAREPDCKCRCKGALHGAKRGSVSSFGYGDPHSLIKVCPKCNGKGKLVHLYVGGSWEEKCNKCKETGFIFPNAGD